MVAMKAEVTITSDSDDPMASHVRAGAHTRGYSSIVTSSLIEISIEDLLVWAYGREKVHLAREPGVGAAVSARRLGFSGVDVSERIGHGGRAENNLGFEAPPDAYAVGRVVDGLSLRAAMLVRHYAVAGGEPDYTPWPVVRWERGAAIYGKWPSARGKGDERRVIGYVVSAHGDLPAHVAARRDAYRVWAESLRAIHERLGASGTLRRYALTADLPVLRPWE